MLPVRGGRMEMIMNSSQITNKIKFETIVGGPIGTNCYVVYNDASREAVIIDPGIEIERLKHGIDKLNVKPVAILLTHGHVDHMMSCQSAASNYSVKVYVHEDEEELVKNGMMNCSVEMFGQDIVVIPDILLKDGQIINLIDTDIKVIHTPGHTKGGCCFYFENEALLFCGDTLFMQGVGRCDLPTGNSMKLIESLQQKLFTLPDNVKAFPGHGPATRIGYEKENNPYAYGF